MTLKNEPSNDTAPAHHQAYLRTALGSTDWYQLTFLIPVCRPVNSPTPTKPAFPDTDGVNAISISNMVVAGNGHACVGSNEASLPSARQLGWWHCTDNNESAAGLLSGNTEQATILAAGADDCTLLFGRVAQEKPYQ